MLSSLVLVYAGVALALIAMDARDKVLDVSEILGAAMWPYNVTVALVSLVRTPPTTPPAA